MAPQFPTLSEATSFLTEVGVKKIECSVAGLRQSLCLGAPYQLKDEEEVEFSHHIEKMNSFMSSLILAQDERWRRA